MSGGRCAWSFRRILAPAGSRRRSVVDDRDGADRRSVRRLEAQRATDDATGLSDELLAGVGIAGTFMGPWQTIVNLDVGMPVAGPDSGFSLYVVFLKLFH